MIVQLKTVPAAELMNAQFRVQDAYQPVPLWNVIRNDGVFFKVKLILKNIFDHLFRKIFEVFLNFFGKIYKKFLTPVFRKF
jgi:hypothetical protein